MPGDGRTQETDVETGPEAGFSSRSRFQFRIGGGEAQRVGLGSTENDALGQGVELGESRVAGPVASRPAGSASGFPTARAVPMAAW